MTAVVNYQTPLDGCRQKELREDLNAHVHMLRSLRAVGTYYPIIFTRILFNICCPNFFGTSTQLPYCPSICPLKNDAAYSCLQWKSTNDHIFFILRLFHCSIYLKIEAILTGQEISSPPGLIQIKKASWSLGVTINKYPSPFWIFQ